MGANRRDCRKVAAMERKCKLHENQSTSKGSSELHSNVGGPRIQQLSMTLLCSFLKSPTFPPLTHKTSNKDSFRCKIPFVISLCTYISSPSVHIFEHNSQLTFIAPSNHMLS